jgi:DNA invertase Pin-like site-specific DNA recombinase
MKASYVRVSSLDQKTDRQRLQEDDFDLVIEDKCSGSIAFFEREGGKEILNLIKNGVLTSLNVWQIDRLGRDLRDIINTIHFFTEKQIPIHFISQGLSTIDKNGNENSITKMIFSILGVVGEMERNQIRERQIEGIRIAKMKGKFLGRQKGSKEDVLKFLSKDKNKKALELLKKGYKIVEVAKITGLHYNTVSKVKKIGLSEE